MKIFLFFYVLVAVSFAKTETVCLYEDSGAFHTVVSGESYASIANDYTYKALYKTTEEALKLFNQDPIQVGDSIKLYGFNVDTQLICEGNTKLSPVKSWFSALPQKCGAPADPSALCPDYIEFTNDCVEGDEECYIRTPYDKVHDTYTPTDTDNCNHDTWAVNYEYECVQAPTSAPTVDYFNTDALSWVSTGGVTCADLNPYSKDESVSCDVVSENMKMACDVCCECREQTVCTNRPYGGVYSVSREVTTPIQNPFLEKSLLVKAPYAAAGLKCAEDCSNEPTCVDAVSYNEEGMCYLTTLKVEVGTSRMDVVVYRKGGVLEEDCLMTPTPGPTSVPTVKTASPTLSPTLEPTLGPTTLEPTSGPTSGPTLEPTSGPTTAEPTAGPTLEPTLGPTSEPTSEPTSGPTAGPTAGPTMEPTFSPTFFCDKVTQSSFVFDSCSGSRSFTKKLVKDVKFLLGEIPRDIKDLKIEMQSERDADLDIQLYNVCESDSDYPEGEAIVAWCRAPCNRGVLDDGASKTAIYKDMNVFYSGYNGISGDPGHEKIQVDKILYPVSVNVYSYSDGLVDVTYSWSGSDSKYCKGEVAKYVDEFQVPMMIDATFAGSIEETTDFVMVIQASEEFSILFKVNGTTTEYTFAKDVSPSTNDITVDFETEDGLHKAEVTVGSAYDFYLAAEAPATAVVHYSYGKSPP